MEFSPEVESLFHEVADLETEQRARYFDEHCVDPDVRYKVEALIACDRTSTHIFDDLIREQMGAGLTGTAETTAGTTCGSYRLLKRIGRGGMGEVWLAERMDGLVKRQVALKLPHAGVLAWEFAERAHRERDILASLTHPGIARLYDAGLDEGGRPFLVMEFVEGVAIDAHCDEHRLSVRERLQLFLQVLNAVQYAHSHLVIHSDLKPSNILVTPEGEGRLLDFGIAKLIKPGDAADTRLTQPGTRALTPAYAAPEQIAGERITTACDIYSLGVIFFELLSGQGPYVPKRNSLGALEEAILTGDPRRPSQAAAEDRAKAANRSASPKGLAATLRGDLDNIALKALHKNPEQRYATVEALKSDIGRYLAGDAILARPDSAWYRTRKFIARHRLAVAAAASVTLALAAGLSAALWEAHVAKQEAQTSAAVQEFIENIFETNSRDQPDPLKAQQTTARALLDIGAGNVDQSLSRAPAAKQRMLYILMALYTGLGLEDQGVALGKRSVATARSIFGPNDPRLAKVLTVLGLAMHSSRSVNESEAVLLEAKKILDRNHDGTSPERGSLLTALSQQYQSTDRKKALDFGAQAVAFYRRLPPSNELAEALYSQGVVEAYSDPGAAEPLFQEAVTVTRKLGGDSSANLPRFASSLGESNEVLMHYGEARQNLELAWQAARTRNGDDHVDSIETESRLGRFLGVSSLFPEGIEHLGHATEVCLRTKGPDDPFFTPQVLFQYGQVLALSGRFEDGLNYISQAIENRRKNRPGTRYLAQMFNGKAVILAELGRQDEAQRLLVEADAILRKDGFAAESDSVIARATLALDSGRLDDAAAIIDSGFGPLAPTAPLSKGLLRNLSFRSELALLRGDGAMAERLAKRAVEAIASSPSREYLKIYEARDLVNQGNALRLQHKPADALPLLKSAVQMETDMYDPLSPDLVAAKAALGSCLLELGSREEASALLKAAQSIRGAHKQLGERYNRPVRELSAQLAAQRIR